MDKASEFFENHDVAAVIGCFRFGSTALSKIFRLWFSEHRHFHQKGSLFLNEFFVDHHYVSKNTFGLKIDYLTEDRLEFGDDWLSLTNQRPARHDVMERKLRWLNRQKKENMISLKLDPEDWSSHGAALLEQYLLNDPRCFKVGLCRQDIGNAMISYAIGMNFNFWNFTESEFQAEIAKPITPTKVKIRDLQDFANAVLSHLNHLLYTDQLDAMVWYDQLQNVNLPNIGMFNRHCDGLYKNPIPHEERVTRYFTNGEELIGLAKAFQSQMDPLLAEVRKNTDHLAFYG
jgi:hypothetical protein